MNISINIEIKKYGRLDFISNFGTVFFIWIFFLANKQMNKWQNQREIIKFVWILWYGQFIDRYFDAEHNSRLQSIKCAELYGYLFAFRKIWHMQRTVLLHKLASPSKPFWWNFSLPYFSHKTSTAWRWKAKPFVLPVKQKFRNCLITRVCVLRWRR